MKRAKLIRILLLLAVFLPLLVSAQEEESAEVFLEEYTDEFQEYFFEALKQKGIENYDKAINALLRCKEMDPESPVIDHELAKTYRLNNQMGLAQEFALDALRKQPENLWYLSTYLELAGSRSLDLNVLKGQIPFENTRLKENLASLLVEKGKFDIASRLLKQLDQSEFKTRMEARIADSLAVEDNNMVPEPVEGEEEEPDPYQTRVSRLQDLMEKANFGQLEAEATDALEAYPLQPFFYFMKGVALNGLERYESAEEYLLMGLDFIANDEELTNKFYKELATTYQGLGDPDKANMYLSRIKNGS
ncbi:tetratricopeptide repeat protein [Muriicola marianensis]|uniref:Tetratricopeptide repeat protein n=1 Tax=Muriicola marianensis TaxID=1324801 RepID=A0ABQ1QZ46_9FLAO|nr:hypothetical protein [Muriicola marianensis]GGD49523.1 hypothetical protein GCM10011361_15280 [Muriicola marianensis]